MLEKELTTYEQSRKLYELGFRKDSIYSYASYASNGEFDLIYTSDVSEVDEFYPAYLLSEIMEALPSRVEHCPLFMSKDDNDTYDIRYIDGTTNANTIFKQSKNPIEAACDLLIWCIENGFISTK